MGDRAGGQMLTAGLRQSKSREGSGCEKSSGTHQRESLTH